MSDKDKEARLAAALRENLRKRKGGTNKTVAPAKAEASDEKAPNS
jgi:hypothetical protein